MKKYLVEFIGTFFLVLTIVAAVTGVAGNLAPIAIGLILMSMVYAGGHISGAHYNPAVTVAVLIRGGFPLKDVPGYVIAQTLGGVAAAFTGKYLLDFMPEEAAGISMGASFDFIGGSLAEFLGTFALCWVVLHTATAKGTDGNPFYGVAIGLTVTAMAYALGGITGGAFNPAVAAGVSSIGMTPWANIGAFLTGQLLAAVLAAVFFIIVNGKDDKA
jgi:aquaporin Z